MPSVKDFNKNKNHPEKKNQHDASSDKANAAKEAKRPRRRPGRDEEAQSKPVEKLVQVVEVEAVTNEEKPNTDQAHQEPAPPASEKVEIHFYGSEMLRAKFAKPFEVAEAVATEWVHDGNFEDVKLGHPLADMLAQQGLQMAKDVEKKVMASPLTEKVIIKAFQAGLKAQELVNQIKSKVVKK